jgi:hypothetical protein
MFLGWKFVSFLTPIRSRARTLSPLAPGLWGKGKRLPAAFRHTADVSLRCCPAGAKCFTLI